MFMMCLSFYIFSPPPPTTFLFLLSSLKSKRCTQWILSLITSRRCTGKLDVSGQTQYRGNILINTEATCATVPPLDTTDPRRMAVAWQGAPLAWASPLAHGQPPRQAQLTSGVRKVANFWRWRDGATRP